MKRCYKCKGEKPVGEFHSDKTKPDGLDRRCKECRSKYDGTRARIDARIKYNKEHPEQVQAYYRQYGRSNRNKKYGNKIYRKYGLTLEQYHIMLESQDGRCAICESMIPGGAAINFHVDHDHKNGVVRGLLCTNCNLGLGNFKDNINNLLRAIDYLSASIIPPVDNRSRLNNVVTDIKIDGDI